MTYKYTGKPSNTQSIGTKYVALTNARYKPPTNGYLQAMLYVNLSYKLKPGRETGTVRVRAVREKYGRFADDPTAYQDFTVSKNNSSFLITHTWFEWTDRNRPIHWEIKVSDDFERCQRYTTYSKWWMP